MSLEWRLHVQRDTHGLGGGDDHRLHLQPQPRCHLSHPLYSRRKFSPSDMRKHYASRRINWYVGFLTALTSGTIESQGGTKHRAVFRFFLVFRIGRLLCANLLMGGDGSDRYFGYRWDNHKVSYFFDRILTVDRTPLATSMPLLAAIGLIWVSPSYILTLPTTVTECCI